MMLTSLVAALMLTTPPPAPFGPVPTPRQMEWQGLETYAFTHFGPNTFSDKEWGEGTEDPNLFNPSKLNCLQWVKELKAAGMKQVIITAKHHDGFCLWPSKFSTHTVAQSSWEGGKGDVLRDLSEACRKEGLKMGIYISPWDRNHPAYGTPEYNQVFNHMLEEVLSHYGPISEVWFDGANGEGPNGKKQVYDWNLFISTVRRLQPNAVIFSDAGPDIRWVGNESGFANPTNWSTINRHEFHPGTSEYHRLTEGDRLGVDWVPAECDVSIRPGWFYHPEENAKVKSLQNLEDIYYDSVGRNGSLLLNVPPDRDGLINPADIAALKAFHAKIAATFKHDLAHGKPAEATNVRGNAEAFSASNVTSGKAGSYWATDDGVTEGSVTIHLGKPTAFDRVVLEENIALGQRVKEFTFDAKVDGTWKTIGAGTTIGHKRILRLIPHTATDVRLNIKDAKACPTISKVGLYASPDLPSFAKTFDPMHETPEMHDGRMDWFREARFGMFIHWGLYSVPAGEWKGKDYDGAAEWLQYTAKIPPADYEPLKEQFNPVKFDAEKWVKIAKAAGMKYIVITSKHHEGFDMWPSQYGTWNIGHGPFKRDPLKELAEACKKEGITFCFYHSIMDWHEPDYLPRRPWDPRPTENADYERYVQYMKDQLKELLTNYGPIGILWFDGEWEDTWTHTHGVDLYRYLRKMRPDLIVNNRVDKGREGLQGMSSQEGAAGDYGTPEQEIPANGFGPGVDWESCMTMNDTWGFHATDHDWKSPETLVRNLVDCASKGGNYLLNVGPTSLGEIPEASIERLAEVGKWMDVNGESVYGTKAGPFPRPLPWGKVTRKPGKLFLHVFKAEGSIFLPGLENKITRAYLLADRSKTPLDVQPGAEGQTILLPERSDPIDTVVVAEIEGDPVVVKIPLKTDAQGVLSLEASDALVDGQTAKYEENNHAIGFWTDSKDSVTWDIEIGQAGAYEVKLDLACEPSSAGSTFELSVGEATVTGVVPNTGAWTKFQTLSVGSLDLPAGRHTLRVKPLKMGGALMNLKSVTLTRK